MFKRQKPPHLTLQPVYQRYLSERIARRPHHRLCRSRGTDAGWADREQRTALAECGRARWARANVRRSAPGKDRAVQYFLRCRREEGVANRSPSRRSLATTWSRRSMKISSGFARRRCRKGRSAARSSSSIRTMATFSRMASWPTIDPNALFPIITAKTSALAGGQKYSVVAARVSFRLSARVDVQSVCRTGRAAERQRSEPRTSSHVRPRLKSATRLSGTGRKTDGGMLNFADALTQSCNTWFYQVGNEDHGPDDHRLRAAARARSAARAFRSMRRRRGVFRPTNTCSRPTSAGC